MLAARPGEPIVPKHTYGGFYGTNLHEILKEKKVDTVILAGVCTNICIQHTAADAFFRGYKVVIPRDGVAALTPEEHKQGLAYMKKMYAASMTTTSALIQSLR
jgi:nicotinamidase-related amidase